MSFIEMGVLDVWCHCWSNIYLGLLNRNKTCRAMQNASDMNWQPQSQGGYRSIYSICGMLIEIILSPFLRMRGDGHVEIGEAEAT